MSLRPSRDVSVSRPHTSCSRDLQDVLCIGLKRLALQKRLNKDVAAPGDDANLQPQSPAQSSAGLAPGVFLSLSSLKAAVAELLAQDRTGGSSHWFHGPIKEWNVINVTDMTDLFKDATSFSQDLSGWDVSNVTSMSGMFSGATKFNGPIQNWVVEKVTSMNAMFAGAGAFNQDLSRWDVSKVTDMDGMFQSALSFNRPLQWGDRFKNVENASRMFWNAWKFNQDISDWNVSSLVRADWMFQNAVEFNQPLAAWAGTLKSINSMNRMFYNASKFDQDLSSWKVLSGTEMNLMFQRASLSSDSRKPGYRLDVPCQGANDYNPEAQENGGEVGDEQTLRHAVECVLMYNPTGSEPHPTYGPISKWKLGSNIKRLKELFKNAASFNQDLSQWDVSNIFDFTSMFENAAAFNQNIGSWKIRTDTRVGMARMFKGASSFNQDLSNWDVSRVVSTESMFQNATAFNSTFSTGNLLRNTNLKYMFASATSFNQPIEYWKLSERANTSYMFYGATRFAQTLGNWVLANPNYATDMFLQATNFQKALKDKRVQKPQLLNASANPMFKIEVEKSRAQDAKDTLEKRDRKRQSEAENRQNAGSSSGAGSSRQRIEAGYDSPVEL